jgi:hypothetical protein
MTLIAAVKRLKGHKGRRDKDCLSKPANVEKLGKVASGEEMARAKGKLEDQLPVL